MTFVINLWRHHPFIGSDSFCVFFLLLRRLRNFEPRNCVRCSEVESARRRRVLVKCVLCRYFLDAFSHPYKRVCPFVRPSRRSVCPSVHSLFTHELKPCKNAIFDQNYYQCEQGRILCRVYGLVMWIRVLWLFGLFLPPLLSFLIFHVLFRCADASP